MAEPKKTEPKAEAKAEAEPTTAAEKKAIAQLLESAEWAQEQIAACAEGIEDLTAAVALLLRVTLPLAQIAGRINGRMLMENLGPQREECLDAVAELVAKLKAFSPDGAELPAVAPVPHVASPRPPSPNGHPPDPTRGEGLVYPGHIAPPTQARVVPDRLGDAPTDLSE